jgi:hypothetical protein
MDTEIIIPRSVVSGHSVTILDLVSFLISKSVILTFVCLLISDIISLVNFLQPDWVLSIHDTTTQQDVYSNPIITNQGSGFHFIDIPLSKDRLNGPEGFTVIGHQYVSPAFLMS